MTVLLSIIIYLIIFGLIWYCVDLLPLPAPVGQIVRVLFVLLLIVTVLSLVGIIPGAHFPLLHLS